ncbi:MAG: response regulator [Candidatus Omnitrophica bacterium]|nr:response regulator [Candidatus Omnitrophota bacterium]
MAIRVLLVEDNPDHVFITERVFKTIADKYTLETTNNTESALTKLSQEFFDLVLCDYNLAGATALDVLKELKSRCINIPLVAITSAGSEKIAVALMQEGAYDYITKDVTYPSVLPVVMNRAINRYKMEKANIVLQTEINKQSQFTQTVLNSFAYPFYVLNRDYEVVLVNKAGLEKGLSIGCKCYKVLHDLDAPCLGGICPLKEVTKTKGSVIMEQVHRDKEGNEYVFEVHGDPIFDENGEIKLVIEYIIDISARKVMETELKKKLVSLEVFHKATVDREIKMIELKKTIVELKSKLEDNIK